MKEMSQLSLRRSVASRSASTAWIAGLICLAAISGTAAAQESGVGSNTTDEKTHRLSIGAGAYAFLNPFEDDDGDAEAGFIPYIEYENNWMSISPSEFAFKAVRQGSFGVDLIAAPRWAIVEPGKVKGLEGVDRETGLDLGARVGFAAGRFQGGLEYLGDVTDKSNGHEVTASLGAKIIGNRKFFLGVEGGASWRDEKLSTYLFGVLPEDTPIGIAAHAVDDTVTPFLGVQAMYSLTDKLSLIGALSGEVYPDEITDSPIVKKDGGAESFLALVYTF